MNIKFGDSSLNLKVDGSLANIDRGPRGYSAYEIAVQEGFVGTEEEWLASLVGPEGKQGKDGERGIQGPRGQQGDKGDKGDIGPQGAKGDTGPSNVLSIGSVTKGNEANATITGESPNQILNLVLPKGDKGDRGDTGATGPQGEDGKTGPQGETGATGNGILSIQKTATAGLVDTYTITFTDGTTTTFDVTNGEDGEVTQAQLDESQAKQDTKIDWLQTLVNQMPTVSGQGTDLLLQDVLNYRLIKFLPQGVSSQDGEPTPTTPVPVKSVTGENSVVLQNENLWDEQWESGAFNNSTGEKINNTVKIRSKNYIPVIPNQNYYWLKTVTSGTLYFYKKNYEFISYKDMASGTFTTPNDAYYLMFSVGSNSAPITTYSNDIMITKGSTAPTTYVEHEEQNYLIYLGGNVFELSKVTENVYINANGTTGTSSTSNLSGYTPVIGGLTYNLTYDYETLLNQANRGYCFYDSNQNYLSGTLYSSTNKTRQITIPTNARYFRFAYDKNCTNISLATDMTPIELNSSPDGTIRDTIIGSSDVSYNLFDGARKNVYFNNQKQFASGIADALTTNYIPANEGDTFTISTELASDGIVIASFDKNKVCISRSAVGTSSLSLTHTCPANTKYIIGSNFIGMTTNTTLVKGSEVKPYFPYGQVGMWYKREYIGKVVLDGSESGWRLAGTDTNTLRFTNDNIMPNSPALSTSLNVFMCNEFQKYFGNTGIGNIDSEGIAIRDTRNGFTIRILKTRVSDLSTFLTWLSEHNAIVYYALENYTDIPITDTTLINQLNDIYNNAHSYNGVTNITTTYEDGNEQMYLDIEALAKSGSTTAETDPIFSASASSGITSSDISNWNNKADVEDIPDLTDYVKNTDYASNSKGGVIKTSISQSTYMQDGVLKVQSLRLDEYNSRGDFSFISKGTLETVITGKNLADKNYVDTAISTAITNTLGGSY